MWDVPSAEKLSSFPTQIDEGKASLGLQICRVNDIEPFLVLC